MPRLTNGLEQVLTNLGIVGAGYKLYFFQTGTSTPKTTYTTDDFDIANTNPVVLNAAGRPDTGVWGIDTSVYRMVLGTPSSTIATVLASPVVDIDPVDVITTNNIAGLTPIPTAYWGTTAGTSSNYTLDPALVNITSYSSIQTFFIDFHIACAANPTIDINNLGTLNLKKYTGQGTKVALIAGDLQVQTYEIRNDGIDLVVLNPEHPANFPANTTLWRGLTYLSSRIVISNNTSDTNNDIDFSAGVYQFSDGSGQAIYNGGTGQLDTLFGTGNGMLATGTKQNSSTYHLFMIYNPATEVSKPLAILGVAGTAPDPTSVLPSGYTKFDRRGSILTDSSGNIRPFTQNNFYFEYVNAVANISASMSTSSRTLYSMSLPAGIITKGYFEGNLTTADAIESVYAKITSPAQTDNAASATNSTFTVGSGSGNALTGGSPFQAQTNLSSQIGVRGSASRTIRIQTIGWEDLSL